MEDIRSGTSSPTQSEFDRLDMDTTGASSHDPKKQSLSPMSLKTVEWTPENLAALQTLVDSGLVTAKPIITNQTSEPITNQTSEPKTPPTPRKRALANEPSSAPKRATKPKGGTKNKSIPVKMSCFAIYQSNDPDHKLPPHAIRHEIQDGYLIIEKLHNMPQPFEKQWRWDNSKNCWWMLIKSEKMYHSIGEYIADCCDKQGLQFDDRREGFKQTSVKCNIEVFIDEQAADADGKDDACQWLCVSGETFFARDICKDYGGRWDFGTKAWDAVSKEALSKIVEEAWRRGFPLSGNFNHDGELTTWLGKRGASISDDGSEYRWSIVKGQAPAVVLGDICGGQE